MTFKQRRQMLDAIHVIRGTVAVALIGTLATAHPSYLNACWPRTNFQLMGTTVSPGGGCTLSIPSMSNNQYQPGSTYAVTLSYSGGNPQRKLMIGSNGGSWAGNTCSRNGDVGIDAGYQTTITRMWTAPSSTTVGAVTIGGGCGRYGAVNNAEITVTPVPVQQGFCALYASTCGATNGFTSEAICNSTTFPLVRGASGSQSGNTLACREYHLGVAATFPVGSADRIAHCGHAGLTGAGVCSAQPTPAEFCTEWLSTCSPDSRWVNQAACVADVTRMIPGTSVPGWASNVGDINTDTYGCRIYHLGAARQNLAPGRAAQCASASYSSGTCAANPPTASMFCDHFIDTCGSSAGWANSASCQADALTYMGGSPGSTSGNTLACRIYHVGAASANLAPGTAAHCTHASPSGGGVCSAQPSVSDYCNAYTSTCGTTAALTYSSTSECMANASTFAIGPVDNFAQNSLNCRIYHLGVAQAGFSRVESFCNTYTNVCGNSAGGWTTSCVNDVQNYRMGLPGATSGDTLTCREYHLGVAASFSDSTNRSLHCGHASASGNGVCSGALSGPPGPRAHCDHSSDNGGGVCVGDPQLDNFCNTYMSTCGGFTSIPANNRWASFAACRNGSDEFSAARMVLGTAGATTGDSLECRVTQLANGIAGGGISLETACAHAGPIGHHASSGTQPCSTAVTAKEFCQSYVNNCDDPTWATEADCELDAVKFEQGEIVGTNIGNTLECRAWHIGARHGTGLNIHCHHSGPSGFGACSAAVRGPPVRLSQPADRYAINFCAEYSRQCPNEYGRNGNFASEAACVQYFNTTAVVTDADVASLGNNAEPFFFERKDNALCRASLIAQSKTWKGALQKVSSFNPGIKTYNNAIGRAELAVVPSRPIEGASVTDTITTRIIIHGDLGMASKTFNAYLHTQSCATGSGNRFMDPGAPVGSAPDAANQHSPNVTCDTTGNCIGVASSMWSPPSSALAAGMSIVVYDTPNALSGFGAPLFCADLSNGRNPGNGVSTPCTLAGGPGVNANSPTGDMSGVCVDKIAQVARFCARWANTCSAGGGAGNAGLSAWTTCVADATGYIFGRFDETSGDTLSCRMYHLEVAEITSGAARVQHCHHSSAPGRVPSGPGVCTRLPDVEEFCEDFIDTCGYDRGWTNVSHCMSGVTQLPLGGNTVAEGQANLDTYTCRVFHLTEAHGDPSTECPRAGPTGGGVCTNNPAGAAQRPTTGFCADFMWTCGTEYGWDNEQSCQADFDLMLPGIDGAQAGDTRACREYHLGVAAQSGTNTRFHCTHASQSGGGVCVGGPSTVVSFCAQYETVCSATTSAMSAAACTTDAVQYLDGYDVERTATGGDSMACRIYHLMVANNSNTAGAVEAHCGHASPAGNGVCVDTRPRDFCEDYIEYCGTGQGWNTVGACMAEATGLIAGARDATTGDTLECRAYHLGVAKSDFAGGASTSVHCTHAGPTGATPCASLPTEEEFCAQYIDTCGADSTFSDVASCVGTARTYLTGTQGETTGNTFSCRVYHLEAAIQQIAPGTTAHCRHASDSGGGVCVGEPRAADFCADFMTTCTDPAWSTTSECLAGLNNMPAGTFPEFSGNTFACRAYHLGAAMADAAPGTAAHCTHASSNGGNVCVGDTDVRQFCTNFISTCGTQLGWADETTCNAQVTPLIRGAPTDTTGNTLGCRQYHLGVAQGFVPGSAQHALHCGHASASGNNQCVGIPSNQNFCADFIDTCGVNEGAWSTPTECVNDQVSTILGVEGARSRDTTACRIYHLGAAKAGASPGLRVHCSHASSTGGNVCSAPPSAADFCAEYASTCGGDASTCVSWASGLTAGDVTDISGNSLGCRIYHVLAAKADVAPGTATHCTHASEFGGGVCVDTTTPPANVAQASFCEDFIATCGTGLGWATPAACDVAVAQFPAGTAGQTQFNTAACREYHLGLAQGYAVGSADRATHCSHASDDGGNVCVGAAPGTAAASQGSTTDNEKLDDVAITAIVLAIIFGLAIICIAELHYQRAAREYRNYIAQQKALKPDNTVDMVHNPSYSGDKSIYAGTKEELKGFDEN